MPDIVDLTSGQLSRIIRLGDQWSFLWDKRRSLWIAAEDCPDGEQVEDADLDVLLAQLSTVTAPAARASRASTRGGLAPVAAADYQPAWR